MYEATVDVLTASLLGNTRYCNAKRLAALKIVEMRGAMEQQAMYVARGKRWGTTEREGAPGLALHLRWQHWA
jgi:hypothetical protein